MHIKVTDRCIETLCCFTSRSRIFQLYGDVITAGERLHLGLFSALLAAFEQGGFLPCHTCCDTGPRFFLFHPKDCAFQILPLTTRKGLWRTYTSLTRIFRVPVKCKTKSKPIETKRNGSKRNETKSNETKIQNQNEMKNSKSSCFRLL
jgi:hypothetical protein